jgi:hypothetical protein
MIVFYFFSYRVIRSIPYGHKPRNRLDLYVPPGHWNMEQGLRPVVIYITGTSLCSHAFVAADEVCSALTVLLLLEKVVVSHGLVGGDDVCCALTLLLLLMKFVVLSRFGCC